jgi:hypothetical protein
MIIAMFFFFILFYSSIGLYSIKMGGIKNGDV